MAKKAADWLMLLGIILMVLGLGMKLEGLDLEKKLTLEKKSYTGESNENINLPININQASKRELMSLPRIGEKTADKIINYRVAKNGFKDKSEIKNISGIGDKTYEEIKDKISI